MQHSQQPQPQPQQQAWQAPQPSAPFDLPPLPTHHTLPPSPHTSPTHRNEQGDPAAGYEFSEEEEDAIFETVIEKVGALVQAEDWVGQVWHRNN
jgi:hypothetical protein